MIRWTAIPAILALFVATAVVAQTPTPQPPRPEQRAESPEAEMTFRGEIVSVDADAKTVTVREPSSSPSTPSTPPAEPAAKAPKTMTLTIDSSTKISSKADKPATPPAEGQAAAKSLELKDLKAGQPVIVKYTSSAGKHVAKSIEVVKAAT
jgi:hypothetical protein